LVTSLFRSIVTPGGLVLTDLRDRIAWGGRQIALSPDGEWVCVPGLEGWHPMVDYGQPFWPGMSA